MPTRKQRRRRAKEFRHEYVWEDEEGNEIGAPDVARKESTAPRKPPPRAGREPQPPSWRRTFKRALIFAPVMFVVISLLSQDLTLAQRVWQTVLIALIFVPFSYFLDGLFWRTFQRRAARIEHSDGRRGN
jgi:hypothetical protein